MKVGAVIILGLCLSYAAAFSDSENENSMAFEEEDQNVDAEEFVPVPAAKDSQVTKIVSDALKLKSEVASLHNSEISSNLETILKDAKRIQSASPSQAKNLKLAMQNRVKALKMQLEEVDSKQEEPALEENEVEAEVDADEDEEPRADADVDAEDEEDEKPRAQKVAKKVAKKVSKKNLEEESEKVSAIRSDVDRIRQAVKESHMSHSLEEETLNNLDALLNDAKRFSKTHNANIKKAMELRLKALNAETAKAESKTVSKAESKVKVSKKSAAKVEKDLEEMKKHLNEAHLSKQAKKEVLSNMNAIRSDAERLAKAPSHSTEAQRVSKAMNLRLKALEEQLA